MYSEYAYFVNITFLQYKYKREIYEHLCIWNIVMSKIEKYIINDSSM